MSGSRQHTIPRFLLKGFSSKNEGSDVFVWMYRRGTDGIEINIKNVGVERDFYCNDSDPGVDDQITALEPQYAALLDELRIQRHSGPASDPRIPRLVAHLCVRTRSLRQSIGSSMAFLFGQLHDHLRSEEALRAATQDRSVLREELMKQLGSLGIDPGQVNVIMPVIEAYLPSVLETMMPDLVKVVDTAVGAVRSSLPKAIRTGHIQALSKDPSAGKRAESYAKVNWFVVAVTAPLFLGDSVCVFETGGSRRFKPFDEQGDDVRRIFLPVSSDRLLVGTPYSACPEPDLPLLNSHNSL